MLSLTIAGKPVEVKIFTFPAGETGVSFVEPEEKPASYDFAMISLKWKDNADLINLALLKDAVRRRYPDMPISLYIPYFPYARQDRVMNAGESLSVKVIANMINAMEFKRVFVLDPHSDVLGAVLNNMVTANLALNISNAFEHTYFKIEKLVSPDAGALKKVNKYAKELGGLPVIRADKLRDTATGNITGTVIYAEPDDTVQHIMVVDDICDGGGTFIPLAKELRKKFPNAYISLFVTHGIFTKGVDIVADEYDNVFVVNNMFGPHPKLKEI